MSELYSDDYRSARDPEAGGFLPPAVSRIVGAVVFLALVAGMAVWAYRLGTRDATEVPIIRALEGPARVQPEDPGGLEAAHQGLEVNDVLAGRPEPAPVAVPRVVAPPAVTLAEEDGPQGELVVAAPDFPEAEPGADGELRMPLQDDGPETGDPALLAAPDAAPPADLESLVPNLIAEALAGTEPELAPSVPGPRPRVRPAGHVVPARPAAASAAAEPARQQAAAAPAPAAPAQGREVSSVSTGSRLVQLGAFDNEVLARQVWGQLVGRHGDLLGAKSLYLERATHNARVFYRLRVAGFDSADQTRVLCEALRGRGVDCIPVTLQ
jgi:hypothetical protein